MKKLRFLMYIVLFALCLSKFAYAQHIKVIEDTSILIKHDRKEIMKKFSKSDTIQIIIYNVNNQCIGCVKQVIKLYITNKDSLNIVFEDSFITQLKCNCILHNIDSVRLFVANKYLKSDISEQKIRKRDMAFIKPLFSRKDIEFVQIPTKKKGYKFKVNFKLLKYELKNMQNKLRYTNIVIYDMMPRIKIEMTNQEAITYNSFIDIKDYILKQLVPLVTTN